MKNIFVLIFAVILMISPIIVSASVKINEIAWMGTDESYSNEWIELYNDGGGEVDVSNWVLGWKGGTSSVIIGKDKKCQNVKIPAGGFYLMERTDDNSVPNIIADCIYVGDLSNDGEIMILNNGGGVEMDIVNGSKKVKPWDINNSGETIGKNEKPKLTAQLTVSGWITATATPKAINSSTSSGGSSGSGDTSTTTTATESEENSGSTANYTYSAHSGSSELSKKTTKIKASLSAGRDRIVLTGTPVQFSAQLIDESGNVLDGDNYRWSFGDAGYASGKQTAHIYDVAGEYVTVLNASFGGQEYTSRSNLKSVEPDFKMNAILRSVGDSVIYITNNSSNEVNLRGWQIRTKRRSFLSEADIIILPKKTTPLSQKSTNMDLWEGEELELVYPTGKIYTSIKVKKEVILAPNLFGHSMSKTGEVASSSENVDKAVDNLGKELWTSQLYSLEEQLKNLQNSLVANVSESKRLSLNSKKEDILIKEEVVVEKMSTTTIDDENIVIIPQKRESSFWKFLKGVFGR
ncbi:MAG: hypothetical protein UT05_C0006G0011 [Parcubacteria group bacterium GW2011_GWF2_38_76]|nr:MAG: hypothetical protein UT05_C0006G0011 [Parcubacteria group bacterium GW2011_GWF2_38_76]HBM45888.1 hypothetical protein [Patescibacteria group bacterium]